MPVETADVTEEAIVLPPIPEYLASLPCRCNDPHCTIPYGVCHCGCGQLTEQWTSDDPRSGRREGEYALVRNGHNKKLDRSGPSLPFLKALPRVTDRPFEQLERKHQKLVLRDFERACILYEAFAQFADKNSMVGISAEKALKESGKVQDFPGDFSEYTARTAGLFLTKMGATKMNGPAYRKLVRHPLLCRPDLARLLESGEFEIEPPKGPVGKKRQARRTESTPTPRPAPAPVPAEGVNTYEIHVPATVIVLVQAENARSITDEQVAEAVARNENLLTDLGRWDVVGRRNETT